MYELIEKYITPNKYSRSQKPLKEIRGIVIHWVANPKSSAMANRNYFENRKYGKTSYGSTHEIIGLNGEIVLCIPKNEIAYGAGAKSYKKRALEKLSKYPNDCTYHIECCHVDKNGSMNKKTYATLLNRIVDLCKEFNLSPIENLWLHYDITGKICHKWFVENPQQWSEFKEMVNLEVNKKQEHWAEKYWDYLNDVGVQINEKRYDDKITRGEIFALMVRMHKSIMDEIKK